MIFSRFSVLSKIARNKTDQPKKNKDLQELELLKYSNQRHIQDKDIWENNKCKLRFRKFPWPMWILGFLWILGAVWVIYATSQHLFRFKKHKIFKEYSMLLGCFILGFVFLYKGKMKTTIFDRESGTLTIKKRNIFCDKRSISTYKLADITNVRAVYRGYQRGGVDTQTYSIIIEFDKNREASDVDTSDADSYVSTSEEELEREKDALRQRQNRDQFINQTVFSDEKENEDLDFQEDTTVEDQTLGTISDKIENKDPFRRGINHPGKGLRSMVYKHIDKGVKEKKGRREELKILETRNKQRIRKQLLLIKKHLDLDYKNIKIEDERISTLSTRDKYE